MKSFPKISFNNSKSSFDKSFLDQAAGSLLEKSNRQNYDLTSLFECPICLDFCSPPIIQCQNGHLVCSSCRQRINCCPTCRITYQGPNIRNLPMEKLASAMMFPCKYTGCNLNLTVKDKSDHENACTYKPYSCPCPGSSCKWNGYLDQVMPHLMHQHKSITTLQGEDIVFLATDVSLSGAVDWVMIQSCFSNHFMLVLEKQEKFPGHQQFFAVVQLIGTSKQAENFVYRLELSKATRKLTWEAKPHSISDGVQNAISSSDCLIFDSRMAQLFADNGNLGINVTISRLDRLIMDNKAPRSNNSSNFSDQPPPYSEFPDVPYHPNVYQPSSSAIPILPTAPPNNDQNSFIPNYGTVVVVNERRPLLPVIENDDFVCPVCGIGILERQFTLLGILLAICFFPFGLICLFVLKKWTCAICGGTFGY